MSKINTNILPNRYQIVKQLGHNYTMGQVTYLATDNTTNQPVVIKQFQLANSNPNGSSGFKFYETEAQILKSLNHPRIPRYLNSFQTSQVFWIVQEYKDAVSLSVPKSYTLEEVKQIAISVLDILIYLQSQNPPIIHRDIKPENILVDDNLNAYLIDFGLAQIGVNETKENSIAAGTFGFMASEQIYDKPLTNATDIYGLGATLICLITGTKSTEIGKLIDEEGQFNFKHLVTNSNPNLIAWLEKIVQRNPKDRYSSAVTAKAALLQSVIVNQTTPYVKTQPSVVKTKSKKSLLNFAESSIGPDSEQQLSNLTEEQITLALTRHGNPTWKEADFEKLLYTLGCAGYGWLKPEGVRQQLLAMRQKRLAQEFSNQTKSGHNNYKIN